MGSSLTISTANATVLLPCATISTANQIIVTAGTRNVTLRGCALRGASTASGSQGGTVFLYSGTGAMVQVGDPTYAADTMGFHLDNAVINTTAASSATAQGLVAYRTQEMDLEGLYFLGNSNQTGMTLDGTGNYTGGTFFDDQFGGFQIAVNAIGHQISNPATTDWMNASTFVRLHIDCPTSGGNPIIGTYGINLQQGDGNTFTGGDVEGCSTALHLGANAQNNTIVGLRNENSTNQVVADAGSSYNNWMTGGTMFTGKLTDNGTRNSFLDTFHRSFNGMNGDWYGSQQDATVTNHWRLGIGSGNERGLLNRYQTDYGYRWTMGLSDATAGEQFYQVMDELNNVYRLSIGQYNNGQSSTNNQTVINAAGTGAVVLNGSNNSGTGGVIIGSGGATESTVATINSAGNAQFNGTLQVNGASTFIGTMSVKNQLDAEIDAVLWAGLTTSEKESFIYKDWNGNSQWYMVKDQSNNWALNSAPGGLDSFKAYQSTNSGDTYIDASNTSGVVRINYETGSGAGFKVYGGNSSSLYASFTGTNSIMFPGLAASSGHYCLQIDNSGFVTNTGSSCGTGGTGGGGTVNSGNAGQIAYYTTTGSTVGGMNAVPVSAGGTGAATAGAALANLGGAPLASPTFTGTPIVPGYLTTSSASSTYAALSGAVYTGAISAPTTNGHQTVGAATGNDAAILQNAIGAAGANGTVDLMPGQLYVINTTLTESYNYQIINFNGACIKTTGTGDGILVNGSYQNIFNGVCIIPGSRSTGAAIHDAGWGLTVNGNGVVQLAGNSPANGQYWYHIFQVDGDEIFGLSNWEGQANINVFGNSSAGAQAVLRCDSTYCGSGLYNPPNNPGIATLTNVTLTMGCSGNSIDWETTNALYLNNVTLQSYNQYGLLANKNGAGAGVIVGNGLYNASTACPSSFGMTLGNPMLNNAQAATGYVIGPAISFTLNNSTIGPGTYGGVTVTCSTTPCTENYGYYVAIHSNGSSSAVTVPILIGTTGNAANASFSGTSVTVVSPTSPGAGDTCDFLRVDQTSSLAGPINGSGVNYAIPGEQGVACGPSAGTYISFTDTAATLGSYAFPASPSPYGPAIGQNGWPGAAIILSGTNTSHASYTGPCPVASGIIIPDYSGAFGVPYATCTSATMDGFNSNTAGNTPTLVNRRSGMNYQTFTPSAIVTPAWYKYTPSGLKGLYNIGPNNSGWPWAGGPTDFFTFIDSNPFKTLATPGNRPSWDANDTAVGVDAASGGLAFRDPAHICNYIGVVFSYSGNLWGECLTSTSKTFTVPVAAPGLTLNGGTEMTGNQGNGAYVQHSTGATSTNDCAKFDANGNTIDAGSACVTSASSLASNGFVTGAGSQGVQTTALTGWVYGNGTSAPTASTTIPGAAVSGNISGNAATATKLASNSLGCLDGWDHLPCTVYIQSNVSEGTATGSYSTVWTSTNAGVYQVSGYLYGTTASTTAYTVTLYAKAMNSGQAAGNGYSVATGQIGTSISSGSTSSTVFNLGASAAVQVESAGSGTNTSGVWSRAIQIVRLQ